MVNLLVWAGRSLYNGFCALFPMLGLSLNLRNGRSLIPRLYMSPVRTGHTFFSQVNTSMSHFKIRLLSAYRYKLLGRIIHAKDEWLIAFDLTATEVYQRVQKDGQKPKSSRTPVFPEGWKTQFGLPFREHQKSMQVDIFEGYAVYGLRDNIAPAASEQSDEAASDTDRKSVLGGQGHES